jgi:hypothetical protein
VKRTRLRPAVDDTAAFYLHRYPNGYDHRVWLDHQERVPATVDFAVAALATEPGQPPVRTIADLSCGDGALALSLAVRLNCPDRPFLGDVNSASGMGDLDVSGSLPDTLEALPAGGVDLFVCSETLEHLDDPERFLHLLRPLTRYLLVTTPEDETGSGNPEHYWGWDSAFMHFLLVNYGFTWTAGYQLFTPQYRTPDVIPTQMHLVRTT